MTVGVAVLVAVTDGVGVDVLVGVTVLVGVLVCVLVGVIVGVGVGVGQVPVDKIYVLDPVGLRVNTVLPDAINIVLAPVDSLVCK